MAGRLDGKVAVITGAASGFGEGIARRFAEEGAKVVVADLNGDGAQKVAADIGLSAVAVAADASRKADVKTMVAAATDGFGSLDILVNNAGFSHRNQPMTEVGEEEFDRILAVNAKAIYLASLEAVPVMSANGSGTGGGVIINTASTAGLRPRPGLTWYNASKGWAITATKSMAVELAPRKIRVNCLCPVAGETGMLHLFMGEDTPEMREKFIASVPLGRLSTPLDIANAALWLASDEAEFITGVALEVDGGPLHLMTLRQTSETGRQSRRLASAAGLRLTVLAALSIGAMALLQPASAHAACSNIIPTRPGEIYLFRGLGNIYSLGPDEMGEQFAELGLMNCVDNHVNWMEFADDILERSYRYAVSYPIVIIGHSLGARAAVSMANFLGKHGIPVAYVAMFDPVESTKVRWNIGEVVNYYVKIPFTNKLVRPGEGFTGKIENIGLSQWTGVSHFNIDNSKELQYSVYDRVLELSNAVIPELSNAASEEVSDAAGGELSDAPDEEE